jgi:hypothetical protein
MVKKAVRFSLNAPHYAKKWRNFSNCATEIAYEKPEISVIAPL